ncbi:MAG: hypothetical protein K2G89_08280, partial [Lachnospiraceae bacterium]|nr:hypothetical protein [Lachnospiraceae bacterium]
MDSEGLINQYKRAVLLQNELIIKEQELVQAKAAYEEGLAREMDIQKTPANQSMFLLLLGMIIAFFGVMCFIAIIADSLSGAAGILIFCFAAALLSVIFAKKLNRRISNESSRQNVEHYHRSVVEPLAKKEEFCKKIYEAAKADWHQAVEELCIPEQCRNK